MYDTLILENDKGEGVEIPIQYARDCYQLVREVESLVQPYPNGEEGSGSIPALDPSPSEETENNNNNNSPLRIDGLLCDKTTLELVKQYTLSYPNLTTDLPQPLLCPLHVLAQPHEMELLRRAERSAVHVQLLDIASYLKFDPLVQLTSAYISIRINEIARHAENIMVGAEQVRHFLQMVNEWTEEEMKCLEKEMAYALEVDPNAF
ncbi:hypothetical protein AGDE_00775 [Angomonas deanei]|uniref:Skp1 family, dimerisation domain containing protein, putative n=1 Tax=Angomonas deanei TaxID=59799 RepID=A0A7G2CPG7_9TRYP|nr:hypothetical protein AGDE_00775 [Angomonas deanei]CAD2220443.1 Skp1 family, dimerisation domain containing protein, putative [Angomonas deanei]|eukprot:EPY43147.1 hypothetical protein AGDE_00775 [Angomonas deanei]